MTTTTSTTSIIDRGLAIAKGERTLDEARIGTLVLVPADERRDVRVDPAVFRAALAGTPWADLVRDPGRPHAALTAAIGNAKKGQRDDGTSNLWQRVGEDSQHKLVYALMRKHPRPEQRELDTEVVLTVEVDRDGASGLTFTEHMTLAPEEVAEIERVQARYAKERAFLTLSAIRALVNDAALGRRDSGPKLRGVRVGGLVAFLMPVGDDEEFLRLAPALAAANVRMVPQEVYEGAREAYVGDVNGQLLDAVQALRDAAEERLRAASEAASDRAAGVDKPRRFIWSTIEDRRADAVALRAKIAFFEQFIGIVGDDLRAALSAVDSILNDTEVAAAGGLASLAAA